VLDLQYHQEITDSAHTANRPVCSISLKCNKTAASASMWVTDCDTDHKARLNFVNLYPNGVHAKEIYLTLTLFSSEAYCISVDTHTPRIIDTGPQRIPC